MDEKKLQKSKSSKVEKASELQKKIEELENQLKRSLADYQNLERRVAEDKREFAKNANKGLILRLLPALDTLMLAGKHVEDEGLKLSISQILDTLRNEGLEKIKTEGLEFDPKLMECIMVVDGEDNKVVENVRDGYILNGQVLRPVQVKVGKGEMAA